MLNAVLRADCESGYVHEVFEVKRSVGDGGLAGQMGSLELAPRAPS